MIRPGTDLLLIAGLGITGLLAILGFGKKLRSDRLPFIITAIAR